MILPSADSLENNELGAGEASWYDVLALVCCVASGILALYIGHIRMVANWGVETDFYSAYVPQALNILNGRPYTYQHYPPGYMIILAGVSSITHDLFTAAKFVSAFATACMGWVSYALMRALYGRRLAFVSTLFVLLALLPHSFLAATDMPANLFLLLPLWIVLRAGRTTVTLCIQAGLVAGLAYLIRYNAIFVIAGLPIALTLINPDRESLRKRLVKSGVYLAAAFLVMLPWLILNWQANGGAFASDLHAQIAARFYHPKGDAYGWALREMGASFGSIWDVLSYDPLRMFRKFLKDIFYDKVYKLTSEVIGFPAYLFAGAGVLVNSIYPTRPQLVLLLVCSFGYLLHGLAGFAARFYLFLFPLLFIFVSSAPFYIIDSSAHLSAREARGRHTVAWLVVCALLFVSGYTSSIAISYTLHSEPTHLLEMARVLKAHSVPGDVIMAVEPHIGYLTGLKVVAAEVANSWELYDSKAREKGARYIIYSAHEEQYWKGLKALSNPAQAPKSFRLIYEHGPTETLVYEIQQ